MIAAVALLLLVPGQLDLVGISNTGEVHGIDPLTGCQTLLFSTGMVVNALARDASGFLYVASNVPAQTRFHRVDPVTGEVLLLGSVPILDVRGLALGEGDELFVVANHRDGKLELDDDLYRVDPVAGTRTYVACLDSSGLQSLAYHGGALYSFDLTIRFGGLVRIDPASGTVTDLPQDAGLDVQGLAFTPAGRLFGGRTVLYELDPATGAILSSLPIDDGELVDYRGFEFVSTAVLTLDFETEDDLATPLVNGQDLSSPPEFGQRVWLSSSGPNLGAAVFDSTPGGPNDPSQDRDLLVGLGHVLILQNDQAPTQSVPGLFDRPNDDQDGGLLTLDFLEPVEPLSLDLVDIDLGAGQFALVTLFDAAGRLRHFTVPAGWTGDLLVDGAPGFGRLCLDRVVAQPGLLATATAQEEPGFSAQEVLRIEVRLGSSGALDNLSFRPASTLPRRGLERAPPGVRER